MDAESASGQSLSAPDVFVAGDCAYGPRLAIHAIASGKAVARAVHRHLTGAALAYEGVSSLFGELRGGKELAEAIQRLRQSKEFRRQAGKEDELEHRERNWTLTQQQAFRSLRVNSPPDPILAQVLSELELPGMLKDLRKGGEPGLSQLAYRSLMSLTMPARSEGWRFMDQREYRRAGLSFEVALPATEAD